jgi:hypothetical protein
VNFHFTLIKLRPKLIHKIASRTDWTELSPCTASCGGGKQVKTRDCVLPSSLGPGRLQLLCPGDREVVSDCSQNPCPAPSEWSDWSECSKSCGGGTRTKVRQCVNQRDKDGNPCKVDLVDTEACNLNPCPEWTEWTPWTECSRCPFYKSANSAQKVFDQIKRF